MRCDCARREQGAQYLALARFSATQRVQLNRLLMQLRSLAVDIKPIPPMIASLGDAGAVLKALDGLRKQRILAGD